MSSQNDHPEPSQASDDIFLTRATLTDHIELQNNEITCSSKSLLASNYLAIINDYGFYIKDVEPQKLKKGVRLDCLTII